MPGTISRRSARRVLSEPNVTECAGPRQRYRRAEVLAPGHRNPGQQRSAGDRGGRGGPGRGPRDRAFQAGGRPDHRQPDRLPGSMRRASPSTYGSAASTRMPIEVIAPMTALAGFPSDGLSTMRTNLDAVVRPACGRCPGPGSSIRPASGSARPSTWRASTRRSTRFPSTSWAASSSAARPDCSASIAVTGPGRERPRRRAAIRTCPP